MAIKITSSAKAKAVMQAAVTKDQQAKALQDQSPLKDRADIKGFAAQYPKAFSLLGVIFTTWRGASSRRPGVPGCWAAYPYPWWSERAKMSIATLKRHLDLLEGHGLIERDRGHHQGKRVLAFIRPTALALKLSATRPTDWEHLGACPDEPKTPPTVTMPTKSAPAKSAPKPSPSEDMPMTYDEMLAILHDDDPASKDLGASH